MNLYRALDLMRADLSDIVLKDRFRHIKAQHKRGIDRSETLIRYVNELEYRGLRYVVWDLK